MTHLRDDSSNKNDSSDKRDGRFLEKNSEDFCDRKFEKFVIEKLGREYYAHVKSAYPSTQTPGLRISGF